MDFSFKFDPIALQDFLNVGANGLKILFAQNVDKPLANDLFRSTAGHIQIGLTNESISKVPTQPDEHEWRSVNDALQLCFLVAQRYFVLAQFVCELFEAVTMTRRQHEQA